MKALRRCCPSFKTAPISGHSSTSSMMSSSTQSEETMDSVNDAVSPMPLHNTSFESARSKKATSITNKYVAFTTLRPGNDLMVHIGTMDQLIPRLSRRNGARGSRRYGTAKRVLRSSTRRVIPRAKNHQWGLVDDDGHTTIIKVGDQEESGVKELLLALDPSRFKDSNRRERKVVLVQWKGNGLPVSHLAGNVSFVDAVSDIMPKVNITLCANANNTIDLKTLRDELDKIIATNKDGENQSYSLYEVKTLINDKKGGSTDLPASQLYNSLDEVEEHFASRRRDGPRNQASVIEASWDDNAQRRCSGKTQPVTPPFRLPTSPPALTRLRNSRELKTSSINRYSNPDETPRSSRVSVSSETSSTSVAQRARLFEQKATELAANVPSPIGRPKPFRFDVRNPKYLISPTRVTSSATPNLFKTPTTAVKNATEASDDDDVESTVSPFKRQNSIRRSLRPFLKRRPQTPIRIPLAFLNNGSSPTVLPVDDDAPISRLAVDLASAPLPQVLEVREERPVSESYLSVFQNEHIEFNDRRFASSVDSETDVANNIARSISDDINTFNDGDTGSLIDEVFEESEDVFIPTPPASPIIEEAVSHTGLIDYMDTISEEVDSEFVTSSIEVDLDLTDDQPSDVVAVGVVVKSEASTPVTKTENIFPAATLTETVYTDGFVSISPKNSESMVDTNYSELTESTQNPTDNCIASKSPIPMDNDRDVTFKNVTAEVDENLFKSDLVTAHAHVVEYPEMDGFVVVDDGVDEGNNDENKTTDVLKSKESMNDSETTVFEKVQSSVVVPKKVSVADRIKSLNLTVAKENKNDEKGPLPKKSWLSTPKKAILSLATSKSASRTETIVSHDVLTDSRVVTDTIVETTTEVTVATQHHTVYKEIVEEIITTIESDEAVGTFGDEALSVKVETAEISDETKGVAEDASSDFTKESVKANESRIIVEDAGSVSTQNTDGNTLSILLTKTVESVVIEETDLISNPDETAPVETVEPAKMDASGDAQASKIPAPFQKKRKNRKNKKNKH